MRGSGGEKTKRDENDGVDIIRVTGPPYLVRDGLLVRVVVHLALVLMTPRVLKFTVQGFGFGPPAPLWPAPVAPASPPPHPTVIDGALLHELLELPDWAQRSILAGGGGGGCAGKTFDEDGSSPHVVAFFDSCDARSDIVPLPTEAVLELIHRVLET